MNVDPRTEALQRLQARRPRALLLLVLGAGMVLGGAWFCWRAFTGWQRWPHVQATVVRIDERWGLHGKDRSPIARLALPGAAPVEVHAKLGEDEPAIGAVFELAVNPADPSDNLTLKAAQLLLLLPLLGLLLAGAAAYGLFWISRAGRLLQQ
jgi:hypothetical protein